MQVLGIIFIVLGNPWMIGWVRRNGMSITKYDHVLHVPSSLSNLSILKQDGAVIKEMSQFIAM